MEKGKDPRSIVFPDNFDLYFENALNPEGVLFKEVSDTIDEDWVQLRAKLKQWNEEKRIKALLVNLKILDPYKNEKRFNNYLKTWAYLINHKIADFFHHEQFIKVLKDEKFNTIEGGKELLSGIFETESEYFLFHTDLLRTLLRKYIDDNSYSFPLSFSELQSISVSRLDHYVRGLKGFSVFTYELFYYNCWKKKEDNRVIILDQANKILMQHIKEFPKDYLRYVIRSKYTPWMDDEYVFEPFIPQYFGSWDEFEEFLRNIADREKEFMPMIDFFSQFKSAQFDGFYSKTIPHWLEINTKTREAKFRYFKDQTYEKFVQGFEEMIA